MKQTERMIPLVEKEYDKALNDLYDLVDSMDGDESVTRSEQWKAVQEYLKNKEEQSSSVCCSLSPIHIRLFQMEYGCCAVHSPVFVYGNVSIEVDSIGGSGHAQRCEAGVRGAQLESDDSALLFFRQLWPFGEPVDVHAEKNVLF